MGIHDLAFRIIRDKTRKLTLLKAAGFFFMFAICAKLVYFVEASHPAIEKLIPVHGVVREVKIGGEGSSTYLKIESQQGTHRYSSYYGKDWPGMERIQAGDRVDLLVEKNSSFLLSLFFSTSSTRTSCSAVNSITFGN